MEMWLVIGAVFAAIVVSVVMIVPNTVAYTEEIVIDAPLERIFDNIRFQRDLMRWSAWPEETGATCDVANRDGELGAQTVFFSKGKRFGHQEVTALLPNRSVELTLFGAGPPQKPRLTFELVPVSAVQTRVLLHFKNEIARPFNVLLRVLGIVRWTRSMHLKDLAGLKRYAEKTV